MLKQLKWDALDLWKRIGWVIISIPIIILLVLLPTNSGKPFNLIFMSFVSIVCSIEIVYLFLLGNWVCLQWLWGRQTQLHISVAIAPWKMVLGKLILALVLNTLACFITLQIMLFVSKYSSGTFRWISLQDLSGIPDIILLLSLINITLMFSNLLARSIQWARSHTKVFMFLFAFIILFVLAFLSMFAYYPIWLSIIAVFVLAQFYGSTLLIKQFSHMD